MKRLSILTSLVLALGFTTACDDDNDSDSVVVQPAPPTPSLTDPVLALPTVDLKLVGNTFASPCLAMGILDLTSSNRLVSFTEAGTFTKKDDFFLGDSCGEAPYLTIETAGTFVDGGKPTPEAETANLDYTIAESFLTIHNEQLLITFNANSYCGKSDWKIDERVSLTAVTCDMFPNRVGKSVADIYAIEDDALYFGSNMSFDVAPETVRPTDVDRDVSYRIPSI